MIFSEAENEDLLRVGLDKEVEGGLESAYPAYDNPFHAVAAEAAIDCDHNILAAAAGQSPGHHADPGSHVHGLGCLGVAVEAEEAAVMWRRGQRRRGRRRKACRWCFFLGEGRGFLPRRLKLRPSASIRLGETLVCF